VTTVIDRRKTDRQKNLSNRQRFIKRAKEAIKKSIRGAILNKDRSIKDSSGGNVRIPNKGTTEPNFRNGDGGRKIIVRPGNPGTVPGDKIPRPRKDQTSGRGNSDPSKDPAELMDEFEFTLTREEFLDFFFEDLELPNLVKTALKEVVEYKWSRSGFASVGMPSNLDITRTFINSMGRHFALAGAYQKKIDELRANGGSEEDIALWEKRKRTIPFMDDVDLRYRLFVKQPKPITKAVMFCLMDVSGSMGEYEKDLAKRFFMLLYMFLERKYESVTVVFIRHTTEAKEVDEQEFFYSKESGGTVVSTALEMTADLIQRRFNSSDYNIYVSQCSDGDNAYDDNSVCTQIIREDILPYVQYFAYVQVGHQRDEMANMWGVFAGRLGNTTSTNSLYEVYKEIEKNTSHFKVKNLNGPADIYPVFRELFEKDIKV